MSKICNINFWIGNEPPPPFWNFSKNSSVLETPPFPKGGRVSNKLDKFYDRFESSLRIIARSRKQNKTKQPTCPGKGPRVVRRRPLVETFVLGQLGWINSPPSSGQIRLLKNQSVAKFKHDIWREKNPYCLYLLKKQNFNSCIFLKLLDLIQSTYVALYPMQPKQTSKKSD